MFLFFLDSFFYCHKIVFVFQMFYFIIKPKEKRMSLNLSQCIRKCTNKACMTLLFILLWLLTFICLSHSIVCVSLILFVYCQYICVASLCSQRNGYRRAKWSRRVELTIMTPSVRFTLGLTSLGKNNSIFAPLRLGWHFLFSGISTSARI